MLCGAYHRGWDVCSDYERVFSRTMPAETTITTSQESVLFESEAVEVMRQLRAAFVGLIDGLSASIHRPADLERVLDISTTLAWQVHRVATSPDPLKAGADVPGSAAARQVIRAARSKGVDEARLQSAAEAMKSFEALVERHAGDRRTFATMIGSLAGGEAENIDLRTRRQAFRINSEVWGVQVKTMLTCTIHHPGSNSSLVDHVVIRGLRDLRRLRMGAPLHLAGTRLRDAHKHAIEPHEVGKESEVMPVGPGLLLDYCTQPCPELEHRVSSDGCYDTYLSNTPLGNAGVQTLYMSAVTRDVEWGNPSGIPNSYNHSQVISKPSETVVVDALFHHGMFGNLSPEAQVIGSLAWLSGAGKNNPPEDTLPMNVEIHRLGTGLSVLPTVYVPQYAEIVETVCKRLGWNADMFDMFRCVVEYPLLGSLINTHFPLPEKGNW